jgi:hypothetical protein
MNDSDAEIDRLRERLEKDPKNDELRFALGLLYYKVNLFREALQEFRVVSHHPGVFAIDALLARKRCLEMWAKRARRTTTDGGEDG